MVSSIIRMDYAEGKTCETCFSQHADSTRQLLNSLTRQLDQLAAGGWLGRGAQQFYAEMQEVVLPALERMAAALEEVRRCTQRIAQDFQKAEQEAGALFMGAALMFASLNKGGLEQQDGQSERTQALIERFRERLRNGQQPLEASAGVGVLPVLGAVALADGPLPIGDAIAIIGLLGVLALGGTVLMSNSSSNTTSGNVDEEKVGRVVGESQGATGNVTSGETLNDDEALEALEDWVGDDVEEVSPGVFRSRQPNADGTYNQGRIDDGSLAGEHGDIGPHVHLERVRPDPQRPGRWITESNNHIPLTP